MTVSAIAPMELAELVQQGRKIELIDVRTPIEYQAIHIPQARNVPLDQLDPAAWMQAGNGSAGESLCFICHSGSRGRQACEALLKAGFAHACYVEGGTLAWATCGLPVVRGKQIISLERQTRIAAGSLVVLGALLAWLVHPAFAALSAFVGGGLIFAGVTDTCGLAMLLARMPWNRCKPATTACCAG